MDLRILSPVQMVPTPCPLTTSPRAFLNSSGAQMAKKRYQFFWAKYVHFTNGTRYQEDEGPKKKRSKGRKSNSQEN